MESNLIHFVGHNMIDIINNFIFSIYFITFAEDNKTYGTKRKS